CPDSRNEPEALRDYLLRLGKEIGHRSVIFPTRDDDVIFLDRYRKELEIDFILTVPKSGVLQTCLDKWETYLWARKAEVATPQCWLIEREEDLGRIAGEVRFPCVLKPVASHHW